MHLNNSGKTRRGIENVCPARIANVGQAFLRITLYPTARFGSISFSVTTRLRPRFLAW